MTSPESYAVFKLRFSLAMPDPDMPGPRYHTLIFVQTNAEGPGTGTKHHVTGDMVSGMYYEAKQYHDPNKSTSLYSAELVGYTGASTYPHEFDKVLSSLPPPPIQKALNLKTFKTEPVKTWEPLTFYEAEEVHEPLFKCTEWTEKLAIPALIENGLLVQRE